MTPAQHGYLQCVRCGVWHRPENVVETSWICLPGDQVAYGHQCKDDAFCSRTADVGQGKLDADEGNGP